MTKQKPHCILQLSLFDQYTANILNGRRQLYARIPPQISRHDQHWHDHENCSAMLPWFSKLMELQIIMFLEAFNRNECQISTRIHQISRSGHYVYGWFKNYQVGKHWENEMKCCLNATLGLVTTECNHRIGHYKKSYFLLQVKQLCIIT